MARNQPGCLIFVITLMLLLPGVGFSASSASVQVQARVLPWVKMNIMQHETAYTISQSDLEQHYLDVPLSATVHVDTNVSVLTLTFAHSGKGRIVAGISGSGTFDKTLEIVLTENERHARHVSRELDFRVLLDESSQIGKHDLAAWISVQAY